MRLYAVLGLLHVVGSAAQSMPEEGLLHVLDNTLTGNTYITTCRCKLTQVNQLKGLVWNRCGLNSDSLGANGDVTKCIAQLGGFNIKILDLSNNNIQTLPPAGYFDKLDKLKILDLSGNDISKVPYEYFDGLPCIAKLDLRANSLECRPPKPRPLRDLQNCVLGCTYTCDAQLEPCVYCIPDTQPSTCQAPKICCSETRLCTTPSSTGNACGDPHMTGFHGQKFDFTGQDEGWYALASDKSNFHLNMRVTSPVPSLPEITYITGVGIKTTDAEGMDHTIVIEVTDPHNLDSACPDGVAPCLADGALTVELDGEMALLSPGEVELGPDVKISAVNLPGACRSFGFEKYWERKKTENAAAGRKLIQTTELQPMSDWILGDPTATNMMECTEFVAKATAGGEVGLFSHGSEHVSFQILTPIGTIRLSHGRLHQLAMRDPTDRFDLPDHLTWQMNLAMDYSNLSEGATGILGETLVPTYDVNGEPIMHGMECIRGSQEDYRVEGPLETTFAQGSIV